MARKHPIPDACPVCSGQYVVSQLRCSSCGTKLEGNFSTGAFSKLNDKQLNFVKVFLKNKGNIQNTGKELGISYPTVKSRLDDALKAMGLFVESESDILAKVKSEDMTIEEAAEIIAAMKK
jgi:hypothetical protein